MTMECLRPGLSGLAHFRCTPSLLALSLFLSAGSSHAAGNGAHSAPAHDRFRAWLNRRQASEATSSDEGAALARQRRAELRKLIVTNPGKAAALAISRDQRRRLPKAVLDELETEVSGIGTVGPLLAPPNNDPDAAPSVSLTVKGRVFRAFLHGNHLKRKRWRNIPVEGIAVDNVLALHDAGAGPVSAKYKKRYRKVRHTVAFADENVAFRKYKGFDVVTVDGCELAEGEPGTPWLPSKIIHIAVPAAAEVTDLQVKSARKRIHTDFVPYPTQPPSPKQPGMLAPFAAPKPEAYNSETATPAAAATIVGDYNLRGYRYVSVRVNPVRYVAARKQLFLATTIDLTITCELPVVRPERGRTRRERQYARTLRKLVVNPDDVDASDVAGPDDAAASVEQSEPTGDEPTAPPQKIQFVSAFCSTDESIDGGPATLWLAVERTKDSVGTVTVDFASSNGTATAGSDYISTNGTLSWADGDALRKHIFVAITNDFDQEGDETFTVTLGNIGGTATAEIGEPYVATVTIVDDDVPGTLQFSSASYSAMEDGGSVLITVTRSGGVTGAASVQYETVDGTAAAGADYVSTTGTLTWADLDGDSKTFSVPLTDDSTYEGATEDFTVELSNAAGASLGSPATATVTINEDDPMPGQVDYLIITSDDLASSFDTLATHRASHNGFAAEVRTITWISTNYAGADNKEKIRACIIDYVTTRNLSYVLLGGDNTVVPDRDTHVTCGSYSCKDIPTDLYYSGLDSNWDENGNGTYGEANTTAGDEGDMAYDVIVGRIPVRTSSQADNYINKVIDYDTSPPLDIARKYVMSGKKLWNSYTGDDRPSDTMDDGHMQFRDSSHPTVCDDEMWMRRTYRDRVQAYGWVPTQVACLFDSLTSWDSTTAGDYAASSSHMQTRFSEGWNISCNDTHGNTGILSADGGSFGTGHAAGMTRPTLHFYTGACLSGGFDKGEPSLSEAMIRSVAGGSLVYLGCSRYGWGSKDTPPASDYSTGGTSSAYMRKWLELIFKDAVLEVGAAFAEHKLAYSGSSGSNGSYRWVQFGLNLQGDPALAIIGVKPFVNIRATDHKACEPGTDTGTVTITRSPTTDPLTVHFTTSGTATVSGGGKDLVENLGTSVSFAAGEGEKILSVTPVDDSEVESDETVTITLSDDDAYEIGSLSSATVTIIDDDNALPPEIILLATDSDAAEEGPDAGEYTFERSVNAASNVVVAYAVSGSAITSDYQEALSGSITIPAGETVASFSLTPVDDILVEGDENVHITLQPGSYTIGSASNAVVTIAENESPHTVTVAAQDANATENSSDTGLFRISRTGDTSLPVDVKFNMSGTAAAGSDYASVTSPVTIAAGATYADVIITPLDDSDFESPESVIMSLATGGGYYVLGGANQRTVTLHDDDNNPPTVSITSPTNGFTYESGDTVTITATATDDFGIAKVEFFHDGTLIGEDTTEPYSITWCGLFGSHTLTARATDTHSTGGDSPGISVAGAEIAAGTGTGFTVERYDGISGTAVANLTSHSNYPASPSYSAYVTNGQSFVYDENMDSYGTRMRALFTAPKAGTYRFYIASDDASELWLSADTDPVNGSTVASVSGNTGISEWGKYSSQKSDPVSLAAGQQYFLRALHKEGGGGDHVAVGVELPGGQMERPIPSHRLDPWYDLIVVTDAATAAVPEGGTAPLGVKLSENPGSAVTVTVARITGDTNITVQAGGTLSFNSTNWNAYQNVTLAAAEDADDIEDSAQIQCSGPLMRSVLVTVTEIDNELNHAPTVTIINPAAADVAVPAGVGIYLAADGDDIDGDAVAYAWAAVSGPGTVTWDNASAADTGARFSTTTGTYVLKVTVTDAETNASDEITVDVGDLGASEPPAGTQIVYFKLDETSGTTAADEAGGNDDGTVTGAAWQPAGGIRGGALLFDGADDIVTLSTTTEINDGSFDKRTIALWFKTDDVTTRQVLYEEGGNTRGMVLYLDAGNFYIGAWNNGENGWTSTYLSTPVSSSAWHHVALVLDATTTLASDAFRGYLDGVKFAQGDGATINDHTGGIGLGGINNSCNFHDGNVSSGYHFAGLIDDFALYNRALSDSELAAITAPENVAPWVDAGADLPGISAGIPAPLTGAVTDDGAPAVPGAVSNLWHVFDGPGGVIFTDAAATNTDAIFVVPGSYLIRLSAWDGQVMTFDELAATVVSAGPGIGVVESGGSTLVTEDGVTDSYTLVMFAAPTATVTVTVSTDAQVSADKTNLVFTPANWSNAQCVTVSAADDDSVEGAHTGLITHAASSADTNYDGIAVAPVSVGVTDNDSHGSIQLAAASYTIDEDAGSVVVGVTRTGGNTGPVSVDYATANGTATGGLDYATISGTLNWTNGDTAVKTVEIAISPDKVEETNEMFSLELTNVMGGAALGSPSAAAITIGEAFTVAAAAYPTNGAVPLEVQFTADAWGGNPGALSETFSGDQFVSYDPSQDLSGVATVEDEGATVRITGNGWKAYPFDYTVTTNTILEFDFSSSAQCEIQGIGLDSQTAGLAQARVFKLYGTQTWGIDTFNDYASSAPGVKHYVIPAGQHFTGAMTHIVFANDDDDTPQDGVSVFSNIKIYEQGEAGGYTFSWTFGDGTSSTDQNPLHTYTNAGVFQAQVVVSDGTTCATDTVTATALSDYDGDGDPDITDPDDDNDTMPDVWESQYGLSTTNANDGPDDDTDGDRFCDLYEYIADTNPTNALSYFCITNLTTTPRPAVGFLSSSARRYRLEYMNYLLSGGWGTVTNDVPGNAGELRLFDPDGAAQPGRFYRVKVWIP